jgi:hypothetical protein
MPFQIKSEAFQIKTDIEVHYDIDWAIHALNVLNWIIGLVIWIVVTFTICYYLGLWKGLIAPEFIPSDLPIITYLTTVLLFIPIIINRVAIKDLTSKNDNTPCTVWGIMSGE